MRLKASGHVEGLNQACFTYTCQMSMQPDCLRRACSSSRHDFLFALSSTLGLIRREYRDYMGEQHHRMNHATYQTLDQQRSAYSVVRTGNLCGGSLVAKAARFHKVA